MRGSDWVVRGWWNKRARAALRIGGFTLSELRAAAEACWCTVAYVFFERFTCSAVDLVTLKLSETPELASFPAFSVRWQSWQVPGGAEDASGHGGWQGPVLLLQARVSKTCP